MKEKFFEFKIENYSNNAELLEAEKEEEKREKKYQEELIDSGKETGVEFGFPNPEIKMIREGLPEKMEEKFFSASIKEEEKNDVNFIFSQLAKYLNAPIITDNFSNHGLRREWEKENIHKLSTETQEYYNSNRLSLNLASELNKFQMVLELESEFGNLVVSKEINDKLQIIFSKIPDILKNGNSLLYNAASLSDKLVAINEVSALNKEVLDLLAEKKN